MAPVELTDISKSFAASEVLSNISCQFHQHKVTAIIGKSGSGKSTLLKLINGLERPTAGHISVFGSPIKYAEIEQLRRRIGFSVQGTGLFPHLTTQQNICLLAQVENWPKDKIAERLQHLVRLVDLDDSLLNRYPYELSGGQQQRAGLCRAMMLDPEILLFDEAFAAVDPITRSGIHSQILKLQDKQAKTIIMVTHDLQEACLLADYIMILHNRRLVAHQATGKFLQDHQGFSKKTVNAYESLLKWLS